MPSLSLGEFWELEFGASLICFDLGFPEGCLLGCFGHIVGWGEDYVFFFEIDKVSACEDVCGASASFCGCEA